MAQRWNAGPKDPTGAIRSRRSARRLNLVTPDCVRAAAREIFEGRTFCLSLPLDRPGGNVLSPSRYPPVIRPTLRNGRPSMNYRVSDDNPDATDLICDDAVVLHTQYSTHWDALSHVGFMFDADDDGVPEPRYYNGFRGGQDIVAPPTRPTPAPSACSKQNPPPPRGHSASTAWPGRSVQGRGVMIDLHARFGDERRVVVDHEILMQVGLREDRCAGATGRSRLPAHRLR